MVAIVLFTWSRQPLPLLTTVTKVTWRLFTNFSQSLLPTQHLTLSCERYMLTLHINQVTWCLLVSGLLTTRCLLDSTTLLQVMECHFVAELYSCVSHVLDFLWTLVLSWNAGSCKQCRGEEGNAGISRASWCQFIWVHTWNGVRRSYGNFVFNFWGTCISPICQLFKNEDL